MTVAADLLEAANLAPQNLRVLWESDTLQAKMIAFWQAVNPLFKDSVPNDRPVGNWLVVIAASSPSILQFSQTMNPGFTPYAGGTLATFSSAMDAVYRLCKFAYYYALITPTQKQAILDAYNAQFS